MTETEWKYKDASEVAKIVRKIVKANWPDVKFSVRTKKYAGGASIRVAWIDGPIAADVDAKIKYLQAVSHMDNTDLVHYTESTHDGETFHSGAHYIFTDRKLSKRLMEWAAQKLAPRLGLPVLKIIESEHYGSGHVDPQDPNTHLRVDDPGVWYGSAVRRLAYQTSEAEALAELEAN